MTETPNNTFRGRDVAVIPFPALGDSTIYLRLAQNLAIAGAHVSFYSEILSPAADLLPWLTVLPIPKDIGTAINTHELVIADVLSQPITAWLATLNQKNIPANLLAVTAKKMPINFALPPVPELLSEQVTASTRTPIHRAFCPDVNRGPSMVEWVDRYAIDVLRLQPAPTPPEIVMPPCWEPDVYAPHRVLLFPTTPNPSKNYPLERFADLAAMLAKKGWRPEIICMPSEIEALIRHFPSIEVRAFPNIRALILHLRQSHAIISNDSGGGHLGSMLGVKTFTITKKPPDFVWRPGFSANNLVIGPTMTIKWFSGRIWHPFIPLRRIVRALGAAPHGTQH